MDDLIIIIFFIKKLLTVISFIHLINIISRLIDRVLNNMKL